MKLRPLKCQQTRQAAGGFSLIEALIGMVILGIVVISMYAALQSAFFTVRLSRENLRATQILIEKMEMCRLYSWDQVTDVSFFPKNFTVVTDLVYSGKMSIRSGPADVAYQGDMKTVTIELDWKTGGVTRHREFVTYIVRNGLQSYFF